jgi:hypothetical protein
LTEEEKIMISIHSRTSTASAGLQSLHEVFTADELKLDKLKRKSETLKNHFKKPLAQYTEDEKEAIGKYVGQFATTSSKDFWKEFGNPAQIVRYRFPIIATSKAVDHPLKFAIGRNVEGSKGEIPMKPEYDQTGHPKHRLAGLLYITLHKLSDIVKGRKEGSFIDFNSDLRNAKGYSQLCHQLECQFFGKIDAEKIVCILPIVYPSIKSEGDQFFDSSYHSAIFGLINKSPNNRVCDTIKIKKDLANCSNPSIMDNRDEHLGGFGLMIIPSYANLANGVLSRIATTEKKKLVSVKTDRTLVPYDTNLWISSSSNRSSPAQKKLDKDDCQNSGARVWWNIASTISNRQDGSAGLNGQGGSAGTNGSTGQGGSAGTNGSTGQDGSTGRNGPTGQD